MAHQRKHSTQQLLVSTVSNYGSEDERGSNNRNNGNLHAKESMSAEVTICAASTLLCNNTCHSVLEAPYHQEHVVAVFMSIVEVHAKDPSNRSNHSYSQSSCR